MALENIILSKVSQVQKAKSHMFSLICGIQAQCKYTNIIYTWKYMQSMYLKVGLIKETKGGGKEGKK
jgi:hypothetical protein